MNKVMMRLQAAFLGNLLVLALTGHLNSFFAVILIFIGIISLWALAQD